MKLISVKTFADVVTVAKEGILARVKGEGGFERVMDMNADQHQNYDTYTNVNHHKSLHIPKPMVVFF